MLKYAKKNWTLKTKASVYFRTPSALMAAIYSNVTVIFMILERVHGEFNALLTPLEGASDNSLAILMLI